jgi:hypothetical protein
MGANVVLIKYFHVIHQLPSTLEENQKGRIRPCPNLHIVDLNKQTKSVKIQLNFLE